MRKARKNRTTEMIAQPQVFGPLAAAHVQAFCRFAAMGIQGCFLLNATVGIAAFAQLAHRVWPLLISTAGAILAICAAYQAYRAQYCFAQGDSANLRACVNDQGAKLLKIEARYFNKMGEEKAKASFSACVISLGLFVLALLAVFVVESGDCVANSGVSG